jgi:hypothetical protein
VIAEFSESGVKFLFFEIKLCNWGLLVAAMYRSSNKNVVYHSLDGDYGLQALEEICSNLLPLYGVCLLEDFNVDLLDPGHSLFTRFLDFLEMCMLCNVAVFLTRSAFGKLFDLFLVLSPNNLSDFLQIAVP